MRRKISLFLLLAVVSPGIVMVHAQTVTPETAKIKLSLQVTAPDGTPLPGATVAVRPFSGQSQKLTVGADGSVALDVGVPQFKYIYVGSAIAAAPGYGFSMVLLKPGENKLALLPGAPRTARVVDAVGAPVGGIKARVTSSSSSAPGNRENFVWLDPEKDGIEATVQADAEGRLIFPDLPVGRNIRIEIRDPRFVTASPELAEGDETIVKLRPGATIRGRLQAEDGSPVAEARVMAQGLNIGRDGWSEGKTDAQGNYALTGLPTGQFNVMVGFGDRPLIAKAAERVATAEGEEIVLPPLTAIPGVLITGTAKDKRTGALLANVGIGLHGPHYPRSSAAVTTAFTDATGRYNIRAVPGENYIYIYSPPENYLSPGQLGRNVTVTAETGPVNFEFEPAPRLRGVVVDEKGKPTVAGLQATARWEPAPFRSDTEGRFDIVVNREGPVALAGGEMEDGKFWEVISPKTVKPPFEQPIRVVVKRVPPRSLQGRAVTPAGEPIPGVKVTVDVFTPAGDDGGTSVPAELRTDAEGRFTLPEIRPEATLTLSAERSGFNLLRGGEVKLQDSTWNAADFVLEPLTNRITGRVLGADGQPVAGAKVSASGQDTVSGPNGEFQLAGLPAGPVPVVARQGRNLGMASSNGADLELRLAPVKLQETDVKLAAAIYDEILIKSQGQAAPSPDLDQRALLGNNFDQYFEAMASRPTGTADGQLFRLSDVVLLDTRENTATATARLRRIIPLISRPEMRLNALARIALNSKDPALRADSWEAARTALAEIKAKPGAIEDKPWFLLSALWPLAVVAEQQEGPEAGNAALDDAIALVLKHFPEKAAADDEYGQNTRDNLLQTAAVIVAQGSPELLRRLLNCIDQESGYYAQALGGAIPAVAKYHGYEAAKPLIEELAKLPHPKENADRFVSRQPAYALAQALRRAIPYFGAQFPQEALALAQRIPESSADTEVYGGGRYPALAVAARYLPAAQAAPIWRQVIRHGGAEAPRFAAWAWAQDPALGRELFTAARAQLPDMEEKYAYDKYRNTAAFAFYLALDDPAESRFLLEQTWAHAVAKKDTEGMSHIARAMVRLDAPRAVEMAKAIPADGRFNYSLRTIGKIARWVEADEVVRKNWPFDRQGAQDFWGNGSEEW